MKTDFVYRDKVNQRIFDVPDYDQKHVTQCWENPGIKRLMSNESSFPPLESVKKAVIDISGYLNFYAEDPSYALALRGKLAEYCGVQKENITLGNGSIELLDLLFQTFIGKPGIDEAILVNPDYSAYTPRIKFFGGVIKYAEADIDNKKTADAIIEKITDKTKFILFSRPNNPVGTLMPEKDVIKVLEKGVPVFVDEAYVEMAAPGTSMVKHFAEYKNMIIPRTFSKGFGLAGARLGYIVADKELIGYINRARHIFNVNLVAMAAGLAAFKDLDNVKKRFQEIIDIREWMSSGIEKIKGLKPIKSHANFIMIDVGGSGRKAAEFVDFLAGRGFLTRDFSSKKGLAADRYFRITVGLKEDMEKLLGELKNFSEK